MSEKEIANINTYMWNREKWYKKILSQSRNRDTDAGNKCMDTKGKAGSGMNWETGIDIYTDTHTHTHTHTVYKIDN